MLAAGGADGDVSVFSYGGCCGGLVPPPGWPLHVGGADFDPDFLWMRFGGEGAAGREQLRARHPSLVVRHADRLWAFCAAGDPLPGWGRSFGDTLVAGLGAGDPDGDGFPEVLVQTRALPGGVREPRRLPLAGMAPGGHHRTAAQRSSRRSRSTWTATAAPRS